MPIIVVIMRYQQASEGLAAAHSAAVLAVYLDEVLQTRGCLARGGG